MTDAGDARKREIGEVRHFLSRDFRGAILHRLETVSAKIRGNPLDRAIGELLDERGIQALTAPSAVTVATLIEGRLQEIARRESPGSQFGNTANDATIIDGLMQRFLPSGKDLLDELHRLISSENPLAMRAIHNGPEHINEGKNTLIRTALGRLLAGERRTETLNVKSLGVLTGLIRQELRTMSREMEEERKRPFAPTAGYSR